MSWLLFGPTQRSRPHRLDRPRRPSLEVLESRCLLSAHLVKDLNTTPGSSVSSPEYIDVNGTVFFIADDGIHGRELWKSDGTETGTRMVKDINHGAGNAFSVFPAYLTNVNGTLFFPADDGVHGYQLWKSDGTAGGTVRLTNFVYGPSRIAFPYDLTNVNGTLFFGVGTGSPAVDGLYTSDGTTAGTVRISDQVTGIGLRAAVNSTLFFLGSDGGANTGLWKSDGTTAGTVFLQSVGESDGEAEMINVSGTLYFSAADDSGAQELWKSDGTPDGTVPVDEFDLFDSYPENLTNFNGTLFFQAGTDSSRNRQLWKSDGTDAGTSVVRVINPSGDAFPFSHNPGIFAVVNQTLYVEADDGSGLALWKSDGTESGTQSVSSINANELTNRNGTLFFRAFDPTSRAYALGTSDGTSGGTSLVQSFSSTSFYFDLTNVNGQLFFIADDGTHGKEPWTSDGTIDGTILLKDIFPGTRSSDPHNLVRDNGLVYFVATGDSGRTNVYQSDGTDAGTSPIALVGLQNLTVAGNLLFGTGPGRSGSTALYVSDGTAGSNTLLANLFTHLTNLTDFGGTLYFAGTGGPDAGLWRSNGTIAGTQRVAVLQSVANLTVVNNTLFFSADDGISGNELWRSDGTNTMQVADINPGSAGSNLAHLTNGNGTLFFSADDGVHGRELWQSDGTPSGTFLAADINPGPAGSDPRDLTPFNGVLFFSASEPNAGRELWQYDPATGNTSVLDINPGAGSSNPAWLTVMGGLLYFSANDGSSGRELWVTDGTQAGTHLVADINPGSRGSKPEYLYAAGGLLYFTANDGSNGRQLWQSDGTAAGTTLVQVINPSGNAFWSFYNPWFTAVNGNLFFVADDRVHGRELWVLTPGMAPSGGSAPGGAPLTPLLPADPATLSVPGTVETASAAAFSTNRQEGSTTSQLSPSAQEQPLQSPAHQAESSGWEDGWEQDAVFLGDWLALDSKSR